MKASNDVDSQALLAKLDEDQVEHLWVIYHDFSGRACAKTIPKARFAGAVNNGVVFARANLDFTLEDHQASGARFLADTGDFMAVPDPASYARLPYRPKTARAHAFMRQEDGTPWEGCPRTCLTQMVAAYRELGYQVAVALEPEFTMFKPGEDGSYTPADHDGMFTVAGLDRHYDLWERIIALLAEMGVSVDQFGKEYGPGQYEGSTHHADPVTAVDNYLTFKEVVKVAAREAGYTVTFMPKPYTHLPGNGLHVHLSLWDLDGAEDLSIGATDDAPISTLGGHLAAGLLEHAEALTGLGAPTVNSYKRLQPASWAPAHICWGVGNRAVLVRIPGMGRRRHLEFRSGDNSANPYLFLTGLLAAGLDGLRRELPLPPPVHGDVGHFNAAELDEQHVRFLPRTLPDALAALESDQVLADALGPVLLPEFIRVKRAELEAYDLTVHEWERDIYLETL